MTVTQWPFPIRNFLVSSLLSVLITTMTECTKCQIYCALCWMDQSENKYLNRGINNELFAIYFSDLFKCLDFVDSCHFCGKSKVFSQSCLPLYAPFNTGCHCQVNIICQLPWWRVLLFCLPLKTCSLGYIHSTVAIRNI